jgi:hypothetical protein
MKTITIGDLHGIDKWKTIDPEHYDKIIFLGDYLDSFCLLDKEIISNFKDIIDFKQDWPDKVVLLFGNHEISYMYPKYRATGYRTGIAAKVSKLLWDHYHLFRIAWQHENFLWSHAGILQDFFDQKILPQIIAGDTNLAATLQRLFEEGYSPIFEYGYKRGGSINSLAGPLWLDKAEMMQQPLKGYHQIVGHTRVDTIVHYQPYSYDKTTIVSFCDCMEYGDRSFYELDIKSKINI